MKLTEHFTLSEMIFSRNAAIAGIDNTPNEQEQANLKRVAEKLEEVRAVCDNKPTSVSSGFRNERVNKLAGGRPNSQHRLGCAADYNVFGFSPKQVIRRILDKGIIFDQLILEYGTWVHISVPNDINMKPRMMALYINHDCPKGRALTDADLI